MEENKLNLIFRNPTDMRFPDRQTMEALMCLPELRRRRRQALGIPGADSQNTAWWGEQRLGTLPDVKCYLW